VLFLFPTGEWKVKNFSLFFPFFPSVDYSMEKLFFALLPWKQQALSLLETFETLPSPFSFLRCLLLFLLRNKRETALFYFSDLKRRDFPPPPFPQFIFTGAAFC